MAEVRIKPDTYQYPELISKIKGADFGTELEFIEECYPNGAQKPDLSEKQKEMLLAIFKDTAYKRFLADLTEEDDPNTVKEDE